MDPVTETFEESRVLIRRVVAAFKRRKGGDYEEMEGEAHVAFMKAYETHDPGKGPFDRWLAYRIRRHLIDKAAKIVYRQYIGRQVGLDVYRVKGRREWRLEGLLDSLTLDGLEAIQAAFEAHVEGLTGGALKASVKRRLAEMDWDASRISAAFAEVREALEG